MTNNLTQHMQLN